MINTIKYAVLFFLFTACNPKHNRVNTDISLSEQLTGIGKIGAHPDSLNAYFCFFPIADSLTNKELRYKSRNYPKLMGDTLQFNLIDISALINEIDENAYSVFRDSVQYIISQLEDNLFLFTLVSDYSFAPKTLYFRHSPSKLPEEFAYYRHYMGSSRLGMVDIELVENSFVKIMTSTGDSIVLHQITLKDFAYIVQFLNAMIAERHTTIDNNIICMQGFFESIDLVYNDSVFSFNSILPSVVPHEWLTHYFLFNPPSIHSYLGQKDTTYKERFKPFSKLPYGNDFEEKWFSSFPEL